MKVSCAYCTSELNTKCNPHFKRDGLYFCHSVCADLHAVQGVPRVIRKHYKQLELPALNPHPFINFSGVD